MWRSKKFVIAAVLAIVVLVVSTVGVVLAQNGSGEESQPKTLAARVAEILGIDQQKVEDAFAQARSETREAALDTRLQEAVEKGIMTQEQATQYKAWCQARPDTQPYREQLKQWRQTRPEVPTEYREGLKAWEQAKPGEPPELNQWQQSKPDLPKGFGFRGNHGRRFGGR